MNRFEIQFFRLTLLLLMCFSLPLIAAAQIEISINIAGGASIAGYEFTLTLPSTHSQPPKCPTPLIREERQVLASRFIRGKPLSGKVQGDFSDFATGIYR